MLSVVDGCRCNNIELGCGSKKNEYVFAQKVSKAL